MKIFLPLHSYKTFIICIITYLYYILAVASLNGKSHLSPHEKIFTIAFINIHYLYNNLLTLHVGLNLPALSVQKRFLMISQNYFEKFQEHASAKYPSNERGLDEKHRSCWIYFQAKIPIVL